MVLDRSPDTRVLFTVSDLCTVYMGNWPRPLATYFTTNQICLVLSHPLHILTNISVEANIVDPDQEQSLGPHYLSKMLTKDYKTRQNLS